MNYQGHWDEKCATSCHWGSLHIPNSKAGWCTATTHVTNHSVIYL